MTLIERATCLRNTALAYSPLARVAARAGIAVLALLAIVGSDARTRAIRCARRDVTLVTYAIDLPQALATQALLSRRACFAVIASAAVCQWKVSTDKSSRIAHILRARIEIIALNRADTFSLLASAIARRGTARSVSLVPIRRTETALARLSQVTITHGSATLHAGAVGICTIDETIAVVIHAVRAARFEGRNGHTLRASGISVPGIWIPDANIKIKGTI